MSRRWGPKWMSRNREAARWTWISLIAVVVAVSAAAIWQSESQLSEAVDIVVYKSSTCGCCGKWVEHLRAHELAVRVISVRNTLSAQHRLGVPRELGSCHTAKVGQYWVEGHVPADLIERLISEQPSDIKGISVPGMPIGSPGMEGANPVEYEVIAYDSNDQTHVYATRQGHSEIQ